MEFGQCFDLVTSDHDYPTLASTPLRSAMRATFVGWEITHPPSGGIIGGPLKVHQPPDSNAVRARPFYQKTPQEVGNLYRWSESKLDAGYGLVVALPQAWQRCEDLMRWTDPNASLIALATRSLTKAKRFLSAFEPPRTPRPAFVLFEPSNGWESSGRAPAVALGAVALVAWAIFGRLKTKKAMIASANLP